VPSFPCGETQNVICATLRASATGGDADANAQTHAAMAIQQVDRSGLPLRNLPTVLPSDKVPRFVVQLHDVTTLHFDLRLEVGGVLRSWAVPKGPSLDPAVRRLAVPVEDHSLSAGEFEGRHAGATRGTGAVIIWDEGTAELLHDEPDHISFALDGQKLKGRFGLTKTGDRSWILVKANDEYAAPGSDIVAEQPASVRSGRSIEEIAE
jgi:DNA ligase D-like protein (predicted 3'-phosphoesterase)